MAINFPNSPATNDTFAGPTGLEYIYDGVKWRSFKATEPVVGTFNANAAISLSAGGTNQNITLTPSGTGVVTIPSNVGIGTTSPTATLSVNGNINLPAATTEARNIEIGTGRTGNGNSFLDLVGDATYTDYGLRIIRSNTGANTNSLIIHRGTGGLYLQAQDAGSIGFQTSATNRLFIDASGNVGIGTVLPLTGTTTFVNTKDPVISNNGGYFGGGLYYDTAWKNSVASQGGWAIRNSSGVLTFWTGAANGVAGSTIAASERLRIDSAGQIGIGGANYGSSGQTIVSAGSAASPAWGTLPVTGGGTGQASALTQYGVVYGSTTTAMATTAAGTSTTVLHGNAAGAPTFGAVSLTADVSGILPVANGGTNIGSYAVGDILYASATGVLSSLADVATGNVIISGGVGVAPSYGKVGLTTHVTGVLPVSNGGTGVATSTGTGSVVLSAAPAFTGNTTFNTNTLAIDATNGRVGIGLTTPSRFLEISGTSATLGIINSTAVTGGTLSIDAPTSGLAQIDVAGANAFRLNTNSVERLRVHSTANNIAVGLGTVYAWANTAGAIDLGVTGAIAQDTAGAGGNTNFLNNAYWSGAGGWIYKTTAASSFIQVNINGSVNTLTAASGTAGAAISFAEKTRVDVSGNMYIESGNFWQYTPTPTALAAGANAITAAQLQGQLFTVASGITTAVTFTLPLATALDTFFAQAPTTNIGFDFYIINTGTSAAAVTVAVNTGITNGFGSLTVAINTTAQYRLRRTAASTYILYRLG